MTDNSPILLWLRRGSLRLSDSFALSAAAATGRPVLPVFLRDESIERLGAAPLWRLERSLEALSADLESRGTRLVLRSGAAAASLDALVQETGAGAVYWDRRYDPADIEIDSAVKSALSEGAVCAQSFAGNLLFEPWTVATGGGTPFRVFTPMWRALRARDVASPAARPSRLAVPADWPRSERLSDWKLGAGMQRGAAVLERHAPAGESAAQAALEAFLEEPVARYAETRDVMETSGTSDLSAFLATGEIGVRQCWHAGLRARDAGAAGAEAFLRQLMWREFAAHLYFHKPGLDRDCWREEWNAFPWNTDENRPEVRAWKRGRTGVDLVDAAMREMMVTGRMHNRARMVVASFLTKHLLADWRIGLRWFAEHLVDWDAANNALGWQWVAGCGPDAAPFFRIFNPERQSERFDAAGGYRAKWIAEGQGAPPRAALEYFEAAPRAWGLGPDQSRAQAVVGLAEGRAGALAALQRFRDGVT